MVYSITEENAVVCMGGHKQAKLGHHRSYPIFVTDDGVEWISLNGQVLIKLSTLGLEFRREKIQRG